MVKAVLDKVRGGEERIDDLRRRVYWMETPLGAKQRCCMSSDDRICSATTNSVGTSLRSELHEQRRPYVLSDDEFNWAPRFARLGAA